MKWTKADQIIFECFCVALRGLKNQGWINLTEHEQIINIIQGSINKKAENVSYIMIKNLKTTKERTNQ